MTVYFFNQQLINKVPFPAWSLSTAVKEPFKNGLHHLQVGYANRLDGNLLGLKQRAYIVLSGCTLLCPGVNLLAYSTLRNFCVPQQTQAVLTKKSYINDVNKLAAKAHQELRQIEDIQIQKKESIAVNVIKRDARKYIHTATSLTECKKIFEITKTILDGHIKATKRFISQASVCQWHQKTLAELDNPKGRHHVLEKLVEEGVKLHLLDKKIHRFLDAMEETVFNLLASHNKLAFLPRIMKSDINLSVQDYMGNTGLIWAIADAHNEFAMKMIAHAKDYKFVNVQCRMGNTALHLAVGKGYKHISYDKQKLAYSNLQLVKSLLAHHGNPNLQNKLGNTPLHLACLRRDPDMIAALLKGGADPAIKNKSGKTPKELLSCPYDSAAQQIKKTVFVFLLDKEEHRKNLMFCQRLLA